ncbi:hypothetical protein [Blastococcus deserti]|uniref:Uncharacterized protein n=1 Tax=Blastococcus deserti TaxID=2259033 RepID=A0ABW4XDK0_9ACTN
MSAASASFVASGREQFMIMASSSAKNSDTPASTQLHRAHEDDAEPGAPGGRSRWSRRRAASSAIISTR